MQLDARGPAYPDLGNAVAKYRRKAASAGSVSEMLPADRHAYGEAVEKAIRAKQRSELQRELPSHACRCASGTAYNDGEKISAAMRAKHHAALLACPSQERRARTPQAWKRLYDLAMESKSWAGHPWSLETWKQAHADNNRLDYLLGRKWLDYEAAISENFAYDHDEATRDNAAWDYHHEYTPEIEMA